MERFIEDVSFKKPLRRIAKHSLAEELVKGVWSGHGKKDETSQEKLGKFTATAEREGVFDK
jgi:hypothetical protein